MATAPKIGFGLATRNEIGRLSVPGPGAYESKYYIGQDRKGQTMGSQTFYKPNEKESALKPGPGSYTIDSLKTLKREPVCKIGTASRNDLSVEKKLKFTTSPG